MSPVSSGKRKSGGRPAGYRLPRGGEGRARRAGEPEGRGRSLEELAAGVTLADLMALQPVKELTMVGRALGVLLRRLRTEARLALRQLAAPGRCSYQEVWQLESGHHAARTDVWEFICGRLGVLFSSLVAAAEAVVGRVCLVQ